MSEGRAKNRRVRLRACEQCAHMLRACNGKTRTIQTPRQAYLVKHVRLGGVREEVSASLETLNRHNLVNGEVALVPE